MALYDAIVVGTGGVGSAVLYELARRGVRCLGLDRYPPGHDRGSSHGATRMIRRTYFEHPDYVPLAERSFKRWAEFAARCGRPLFRNIGLLQVGPEDGTVISGVLDSATEHGLAIERLSAAEVGRKFEGLRVPQTSVGLIEPGAGYLSVEACVVAHMEQAVAAGAIFQAGQAVKAWYVDGSDVVVETEAASWRGQRLIVCAGAWAGRLLSELGVSFEVRRKPQYWYETSRPVYLAENGCPAFLFETPEGFFYGLPEHGNPTLKLAQHSGGRVVNDPDKIDRDIDAVEQAEVEAFARDYLPFVTRSCTRHAVCMYTMTRDEHFIVDRHPAYPQVTFAAGLSGHGFKFTPVLAEALADLALDGGTELPVEFLRCGRPGLTAR